MVRQTFFFIVILILAYTAISEVSVLIQKVQGQTNTTTTKNAIPEQNHTLSVTGTSSSNVSPDQITVSLSVENTALKADIARNLNAETMTKVMNALVNQTGLDKDQITTTDFNISPNYDYSTNTGGGGGGEHKIISYTTSNTIQIKTSKFKENDIPRWIDIAIANGANKVNSINFDVSPLKQSIEKQDLVKNAYTNAKNLADSLSSEAGVKITGIKSLNIIQSNNNPTPIPYRSESFAMAATPKASTHISVGQQELSIYVEVVFLITP
jgi:uncharacterized protein